MENGWKREQEVAICTIKNTQNKTSILLGKRIQNLN